MYFGLDVPTPFFSTVTHEVNESVGPGVPPDVPQVDVAGQKVTHHQAVVLAVEAVAAQHLVGEGDLGVEVLEPRIMKLMSRQAFACFSL